MKKHALKLILTGLFLLSSTNVILSEMKNGWFDVSGTAIHYFSTVITHSSKDVDGGKITRTTETIDIKGDLNGRLLYHIRSIYDFNKQTLTNKGHQVFSGTVKNSEPIMILDDQFEFVVGLDTGAVKGKVFLNKTLSGESMECNLIITGTGINENGDGLADYSGQCRKKSS